MYMCVQVSTIVLPVSYHPRLHPSINTERKHAPDYNRKISIQVHFSLTRMTNVFTHTHYSLLSAAASMIMIMTLVKHRGAFRCDVCLIYLFIFIFRCSFHSGLLLLLRPQLPGRKEPLCSCSNQKPTMCRQHGSRSPAGWQQSLAC